MKTLKIGIILLALLLAAMVTVPMVNAKTIDVDKIQLPTLQINTTQQNTVITGALSPISGTDIYTVPIGSIIHNDADGTTRVFDYQGKQILVTTDAISAKVSTPQGLQPATNVHPVPQGASVLRSKTAKNTTYILNKNGDLIMTVIDDATPQNTVSPLTQTLLNSWWLAWATGTPSQVTELQSEWYTPTPPSPGSTFALAIFNGLETSNMILQPVLQWNYDLSSDSWSMASWLYTNSNGEYPSSMVNVNQGDLIQGTLQYTTQNGETGWLVTTSDLNNDASTSLFTDYVSTTTGLEIADTLEQAKGANSNPDNMCGNIVFENTVIPSVTLSTGTISVSGWSGLFNSVANPNPTQVSITTP